MKKLLTLMLGLTLLVGTGVVVFAQDTPKKEETKKSKKAKKGDKKDDKKDEKKDEKKPGK